MTEQVRQIQNDFVDLIADKLLVQNPGSMSVLSCDKDHIRLVTASDEEIDLKDKSLSDKINLPISILMDVQHHRDTDFYAAFIQIFTPDTILEMVDANETKNSLTVRIESSNRGNTNLVPFKQFDTDRELYLSIETTLDTEDAWKTAALLMESVLARNYAEMTGLTLEDLEGLRDYHRNPAFNDTLDLLKMFQLEQ